MAGKLEKNSAEKIADIFSDERLNEYYLAHQLSSLMTVTSESRMYSFFDAYKQVTERSFAPNQMAIDLTEYDV